MSKFAKLSIDSLLQNGGILSVWANPGGAQCISEL